jgi:hypothetical protein
MAEGRAKPRLVKKVSGTPPMQRGPQTCEQWARACIDACNAAVEAEHAKNPRATVEELLSFGRSAFLGAMPLVTSHANARAYIACIAAGVPLEVFTTAEANKLMFIAQTAISAHRGKA